MIDARRSDQRGGRRTWLTAKLAEIPEGIDKKEAKRAQVDSCARVYQARRRLWIACMLEEPIALADAFDARSANADDYSNRQGVDELRQAIATWLRWSATKKASKARSAGQTSMFLPDEWPHLSASNAKSLARCWPHLDLVADRDCQITIAVSGASTSSLVRSARSAFDRETSTAMRWNGRLVIATARRYFAGDTVTMSFDDILAAGTDGLWRGLMDFQPEVALPSTHLVTWIQKRIRSAIDDGAMIHVPIWIRSCAASVRRGSPAWVEADRAGKAAAVASRRRGEDDRAQASASADAFGAKLRGVDTSLVIPPIDSSRLAEAIIEIEDGASAARVASLAESLGLPVPRTGPTPADTALHLLAPLERTSDKPAASIREAILTCPHWIDSLDAPVGGAEEEGDRRTKIDQVESRDDHGDAEEEIGHLLAAQRMRELLLDMSRESDADAERAEIIRRLHGLDAPEETIADIAARPLLCSGRRLSRRAVATARDAGLAWMRERMSS